jgi:hypothetical protein
MMLRAKCKCGEELTEEQFVPCCDRCGKPITDEMLAGAVLFLVTPGDEDPDGEGPQFLTVVSTDINGEPDDNHYCKTCTSFLLDQSFISEMRAAHVSEAEEEPSEGEEAEEDGGPEEAADGVDETETGEEKPEDADAKPDTAEVSEPED